MTVSNILKWLLAPFSLLYLTITSLRNYLYDKKIFRSTSFNIPTVVVGNLSVGGTGKTPQVAYLIELFQETYQTAVLSRGYGRKTKGFIEASETDNANSIGDEPYLYFNRYPKIKTFVCEKRVEGINTIIAKHSGTELVILDDAFQHRALKPSFSIVLSSYNKLFTDDYLMPLGSLREAKNGVNRADVVLITKCPSDLSLENRKKIQAKINFPEDKVFFTGIAYDAVITSSKNTLTLKELVGKKILLVTGIANPNPLVEVMNENGLDFSHLKYADHHTFSQRDLKEIKNAFIKEKTDFILTTEKDYMRLKDKISNLYYWKIKTHFLDGAMAFNKLVEKHIVEFNQSNS